MVANPKQFPSAESQEGIAHALLAVDGSPASVRAAERLRHMLAAFPNARLTVMYVAHLPRDLQVSGSGSKLVVEFPLQGMVRATAAPALDAATKALGNLAHKAEHEVQIGEPAREICEFAQTEGVDLIVMGTRGIGTDDVAIGSVSQRVLSLAHCPVMLVK